VRWFRPPPDLTVSNEYYALQQQGCINCNALLDVFKSVTGDSWSEVHCILSKMPSVSKDEAGCWAYCDDPEYPACLHGLKDDNPRVIQARNEIMRARQAIANGEKRAGRDRRERAKQLRKVQNRPLP
jgi:hypothetical protein